MISPIVRSERAVTLVGGGQATPEDLQKALTLAPTCVAADGGANTALAAGVKPLAVIGDFDSLSDQVRAAIPLAHQHKIAEQDSTDFEKALRRIAAPLVVGVGFLGGRVDHQLGVFHVLLALQDRPCVLIGGEEVICLAPPQIELPTQEGDTVSLFPLAPVTGRSQGLHWPIEGIAFEPGLQVGTSNRATGVMRLRMDSPGMLLILPRRLMPELCAAVAPPHAARWPVRTG